LEKSPKPFQQTPVTLERNGAENSEESIDRKNDKETETDERRSFKSAATIVGMCWLDDLIEANDLLMELSANATNKPVAERRHLAEQNCRRGLVRPSACGSGVSATSPLVML
jgi:hypothetical protein